jgi:hypothetical protein
MEDQDRTTQRTKTCGLIHASESLDHLHGCFSRRALHVPFLDLRSVLNDVARSKVAKGTRAKTPVRPDQVH